VLDIDGHLYRYDTGRPNDVLSSIVFSQNATTDTHWLTVIAYAMDTDSQERLTERLNDVDDRLSGLGLTVIADRMAYLAFGMEMFAAATLAHTLIQGWVPFAGWAASHGLNVHGMPIHVMLASVYGWLVSNCQEQKDVDSLNRKIFGKSNPWRGR